MRCRQPVQPRAKSAATQPVCVEVKRGERMAKTQCASGDRRDRTRLGRSEPPPRPLEVADSVHFVLIGCVPASNRRTRRHAAAGPTQSAASSTVRLTSYGRQRARRRQLPRRRPLRLRRARSPPQRVSQSRPAKRAEPAQLAGDRLRLLGGFSASERLGDRRTSLCERAGTTDAIVGAAPDEVPLHSGQMSARPSTGWSACWGSSSASVSARGTARS